MNGIWILILVAIASVFIVVKSAEYLLMAITNYARKTGISDFLIGFLIVALGTSLPELITGIMSALIGKNELSLGNVIGANILDSTLVLGLALIFMGKTKNNSFSMGKRMYFLYLIIILPLLLGLDGNLSRIDGLIMIILFVFYVISLVSKEAKIGKVKKSVKFKHIVSDMIIFLIALGALLLASRWLVFSSVTISKFAGIPLFIIGLIFISIATTLPELIISVRSALKKQHGLSLGNVFGTVALNASFVLGVSTLIHPITFDFFQFLRPVIFMIASVVLTHIIFSQKNISSKHGWILVFIYILFLGTELTFYR